MPDGSTTSGCIGSLQSFVIFSCADALSQCVTGLSGGNRYDFGGKILIPKSALQTTGGQGVISARWYSGACSTPLGSDSAPIVDSTANADVWTPTTAAGVIAPPGTTSALL